MKKKIAVLVLVIVVLFLLRGYLNVDSLLSVLDSVQNNPLAPLWFVLIYAVAVTLVVPASALTLLSGPLFGFWGGLLLTTIGANLGCHLSYFLAKLLGKDLVTKFIKGGSFIENAQKKAQDNSFVFMMYARLIPLFPFAGVNYLSGIIGIRYRDYAIATLFGMIPGSAVYVYLGYSASNIRDNPLGLVVSIVVLILFTVVMTVVKKKGLFDKEHKADEKGEEEKTETAKLAMDVEKVKEEKG